jgi:mannose-1-phosphate guanylyltransferase
MSNLPVFAVIMAGGQGTRLWPLSRVARPKQFLALTESGRTLLQEAARRAVTITGSIQNVLIATQANQVELVKAQLPELPAANLLIEPVGRNTAPCLALAAYHIRQRAPEAVMSVLPVDHLFEDEAPWFAAIRMEIAAAAESDALVTIGLTPASPSSNFGYLHLGDSALNGRTQRVIEFIEKPARDRAEKFLASGEYLWNTGTFAWKVSVFWRELEKHLPQVVKDLQALGYPLSFAHLEMVYAAFPNISVDYAIMEKAAHVLAVRGAFKRIDVGSLANLTEIWPADENDNAVRGDVQTRDSRGNIVYTDEGIVGLIGVENLVVVRAGDVVLVCPRERVSEIKELVAQIKASGAERYL